MSSERPDRLSITWNTTARANIRSIDRAVALDILHCTARFLSSGEGDVKKLQVPLTGYRLRCGDYRLFFQYMDDSAIEVIAVRHRREAYRH